MQTVQFAFIGWTELLLIALVVMLFFGARRLPQVFKGLGEGIREFKQASKDVPSDPS